MKHRKRDIFIGPASTPSPKQALPWGAPPSTPAMPTTPSIPGAAHVVPGMSGTPSCSQAARTDDSGDGDTRSTSPQSELDLRVWTVIGSIGCNAHTEGRLFDAWTEYRTFSEQRGTLPARLEDISPADLTRFVAHARSVQRDIDALLMMLTMLGSLLVRAGNNPAVLAALTAAVRRMRVKNTSSGKYAYVKQSVAPTSGEHADSGSEV